MPVLATAVLAESLTTFADLPAEVRAMAGPVLLRALGLATRPGPEPDDDDGPWCQTEVTQ